MPTNRNRSQAGQHSMEISTFKNAFDGGTRANRFIVSGKIAGEEIDNPLLIKAASMPVQTVGILRIPFRGRFAKLPGDRDYAEWTFSILDESTHDMRRKFEAWHEQFNWHKENLVSSRDILSGTNTELFTQWTVTQIDMSGNEVRTVSLHNCWPVEVGAIDLSYDSPDTLNEYTVTLAYDYISLDGGTGLRGGTQNSNNGGGAGYNTPLGGDLQ